MGTTLSRALVEFLKSIVPAENVRPEEPLASYTTFRVGGPAKVLVIVENREQLAKIVRYLNLVEWPYFILGNGSNLLVGDKGYRGVVLKLAGEFEEVNADGLRVKAGSASLMSKAARSAMEASLTGMEFAAGIPGSIGGGVRMNAGAYGGEMRDIVESVEVMCTDGTVLELDNATMEFGYRSSVLKNRPFIVLSVTMKLNEGNKEEILAYMNDLAARRREKQPLEYPSAGSTFKRPEGYFAGKLIMDAGLRGFQIGGAKVSDKHCGFVVNDGGATASDVLAVISHVKKIVEEQFGVKLETEVIFLGDF